MRSPGIQICPSLKFSPPSALCISSSLKEIRGMGSPAACELMKGQDCLAQLVYLLNRKVDAAEEKLAAEAMVAVSRALSLLQDVGSMSDARERSIASQCSCEVTSVLNSASKGKLKSRPPDKAAKRRSHPYMGTLLSKTLEDGFTWRKYGQKDIQSQSDRPRSCYRCTHKPRGCQAIRQVQRSREDPSSYIIIYIGQHTCRDAHRNSFSSADSPSSSISLTAPPPKQEESDCNTLSTHGQQLQLDAGRDDAKSGFGSSISLDVDSFFVDRFDHDVVFFGM